MQTSLILNVRDFRTHNRHEDLRAAFTHSGDFYASSCRLGGCRCWSTAKFDGDDELSWHGFAIER
jgi:hypothetical protein